MNFSRNDIPEDVINTIRTLHENSFEGWIVGGAIRSLLMGIPPKDWDLTTNAKPEQVQKIFSHVIETGIAYGTVTVMTESMQIQITTFRKEGAYLNHRKPADVEYCQNIEDDLSRRDFTINAIAYDPVREEMIDPFQGADDIEYRWIRAVGSASQRFEEDALRILRALRFQGQTGFTIDQPTLDAMKEKSPLLKSLSWERIHDECSKWIVSDHLSMTKETVQNIRFLEIFQIPPSASFMKNWDLIAAIEPVLVSRWTAWLDLYLGDSSTDQKQKQASQFLSQLKYSQSISTQIAQRVGFLSLSMNMDERESRLLLIKKALDIGFQTAIPLLEWKLQQTQYKPLIFKVKNHLENLQKQGFDKMVRPLAIDGHQIMEIAQISPGPQIKKLLDELETWVLDHPESNSLDALSDQVRSKK